MRPPNPRQRQVRYLAALEKETLAFGKPDVYVHGDTHIFRIDKPLVGSGVESPCPFATVA